MVTRGLGLITSTMWPTMTPSSPMDNQSFAISSSQSSWPKGSKANRYHLPTYLPLSTHTRPFNFSPKRPNNFSFSLLLLKVYVNAVHPGFVATDLQRYKTGTERQHLNILSTSTLLTSVVSQKCSFLSLSLSLCVCVCVCSLFNVVSHSQGTFTTRMAASWLH